MNCWVDEVQEPFMIRVAFQGEHGAFSEDAVITFFGSPETRPYPSWAEVFEAVSQGNVEYGVVPVENSQAGSINDTYDLLLQYPLSIIGEINLKVNHCLMALPGERMEDISIVYSHPQALAQCQEFLRTLKVKIVPSYNTAGSAKDIKQNAMKGCGAIASSRAAQLYDLQILAADIQTNQNNYTKFFVISRQKAERTEKSKTSLVFACKNLPGALYDSLGAFATRNINLTKLESRPSRDKPWQYIFYVDFEGHEEDELCRQALEALKQKATIIKILGSYPRAEDS